MHAADLATLTAVGAIVDGELTGRAFADESAVLAASTVVRPAPAGVRAFALPDLVVEDDGSVRIIEVNGSNGLGSIAYGMNVPRAAHLAGSALARRASGRVIVLVYQHGTACVPEYTALAVAVTAELRARLREPVVVAGAGAPLPSRGVVLLIGSIEQVAPHLIPDGSGLRYAGEPVAFVSNVNVVPAVRRLHDARWTPEPELFHDGPLLPYALDKGLQQQVVAPAPYRAQRVVEASSLEEAVDAVVEATRTRAVVAKINAGSGGTGVVVFERGTTADQAAERLSAALASTSTKYGGLGTAFPLRLFDFVQATPYRAPSGGDYLWDLRVQVEVADGEIRATPLSARRCPSPFTGELTPASTIVNLTGRAEDAGDRVLEPPALAGGLAPRHRDAVERMTDAAIEWTLAALAEASATERAA